MKISILLSLCTLCLVGCGDDTKTHRGWSFMPNMHEQPSLRAQEPIVGPDGERSGRGMRTPVAGTVSRHFSKYKVVKGSMNSSETINPLPAEMEVLKAGRRSFAIYCAVCHGESGAGDGNVIPSLADNSKLNSGYVAKSTKHFPPPPALYSEKVREMTDGEIFNYITHGGAIMPKYDHLPVEMRWSIVHYLRVLFRANHASKNEHDFYVENKDKLKDPSAKDIVHKWRNK